MNAIMTVLICCSYWLADASFCQISFNILKNRGGYKHLIGPTSFKGFFLNPFRVMVIKVNGLLFRLYEVYFLPSL